MKLITGITADMFVSGVKLTQLLKCLNVVLLWYLEKEKVCEDCSFLESNMREELMDPLFREI